MRESKAQLTDRLRREGRWPDFVRRREELKAAGASGGDAWATAAAEFQPLDGSPVTRTGPKALDEKTLATLRLMRRERPVGSCTAGEEMDWVGSCLGDDAIDENEAPSVLAFQMLIWARTDPGYAIWFKQRISERRIKLAESETKRRFVDDGRNLDDRMRELQDLLKGDELLPGTVSSVEKRMRQVKRRDRTGPEQ